MKILFFIISFTFLYVSQSRSEESRNSQIAKVLDKDGKIIPGTNGGFSAEGYSMITGENGEPVFSPQSVSSGTWSAPGPYLSSSVSAIAVIGTKIYVGGQFQAVNGSPADYLIQWNGSSWTGVGGGVNSDVSCLTVAGTDLYVGGFFSDAGGSGASKIAKWDGTNWSAIGGGTNNGRVRAICVTGNIIYAAGEFTHIGDVFANYVAMWDGAAWNALGQGTNYEVWDMVLSGNDLYVGGLFTTAGLISAKYVARWNNGWHTLGSGLEGVTPPSTAYCTGLAVSGSDIYVGGIFSYANGVPANNIAKWNGTTFSALGNGLDFEVTAISIAGNNIYAGGFFTLSGTDTVKRVAKWNGTTWSAMGSGVDDGNVYTMAYSGNDLYVGGGFLNVSGIPAMFLAKWHDDGIAGVGLPISGGGGFINFNTSIITGTSISIGAGAGNGSVNVFFYQSLFTDSYEGVNIKSRSDTLGVTGNISEYAWIINQTGLSVPFAGKIRFKLSDIPNNGITNPDSIIVYSRPTPGTGNFSPLPTTYIAGTGEIEADVTSFSEFVFGSTFNALPVELESFTSFVNGRNVNLNWSTGSEENNSGFEVSRLSVKENNNVWVNAGFVNGSGTTNQVKNYSFTDRNLSDGKYSYRLKQIDYNGNFKYYYLSNEVVIGIPVKYSLSRNYPNPFNPSTKISYELPSANFVSLKIFDINGKLVKELVNENQNAGTYSVDFNAGGFPSGTYFYRLSAGEFQDTKKMILVK